MPPKRRKGRKQIRLSEELLFELPADIKWCIFDFLAETEKCRTVAVFQPNISLQCCTACSEWEANWFQAKRVKRWSPWYLTQVSKEFNRQWRPFYFSRTQHLICPSQLKDYLATFFHGRGEHIMPDERWGPPVNRGFVYLTAETVARTSLNEFLEAEHAFGSGQLGPFFGKDAWGKGQEDKKERTLFMRDFKRLNKLLFAQSLRELFPGADGAGKMEGIFMDRHRNVWLHPTPGYLSSCPALDPDMRNALYEVWSSVSIRSLNLLVIPLPEKVNGMPKHEDHCKLDCGFWEQFPHRSHISSVSHANFVTKNRGGFSFVVRPRPYVLPEEYGLNDIGINEQEILKAGGAAVYVQLFGVEDDEFNIRGEDPDEQADKDFTMPDADTDIVMTDAPEVNEAADSVDDDHDMEGSGDDGESDSETGESGDDRDDTPDTSLDLEEEDVNMILLLKRERKMPLGKLMESVYGVKMEQALEDLEQPAEASSYYGGHTEVVQLLLEKGADWTVANKNGWTPIYLASSNGHTEVVRLLLEANADMAIVTKSGQTPIHGAALDIFGRPPFFYAIRAGDPTSFSVLKVPEFLEPGFRDVYGSNALSICRVFELAD